MAKSKGRVTIPTDIDMIPETLEMMEKWGGDALRDADGTNFPEALRHVDAKIYATYYTTRKDNAWAKAHPEEVQQCYVMTGFHTATEETLTIPLMQGISGELMQANNRDDIARWWEVMDRTTGEVVPPGRWAYDERTGFVIVSRCTPFHEYTVSFLAYLIWDPVHMYNTVVNDWTEVEHQITFDVRQPETRAFSMERLRKFLRDNPHVDVVRFTTFFHQFTLIFDELKREKYVDWFGYSASVSPYILEQFEEEVGYPFRPEYIIDQGYHNGQYRIPSREYKDFMAFQRREVAALAKEMVDIVHEEGREAMMFLGDHWIGTEPYMEEFKGIGLDAVVGSVGNASTLRLISDIEGVSYREGRFLPYFFPDTFCEGGDPVTEAKVNWVAARRAILRKPIDRIGYGGYLKLALQFPEFVSYIAQVTEEFRMLYDNIKGTTPHCFAKVGVLNCWGRMRGWGAHMVHHALYQKQNYSYAGVLEILAGAPYEVVFLTFEEIMNNPGVLDDVDVLVNVGDGETAHGGGPYWGEPAVLEAVRGFIAGGKGFVGIGEPTAYQWQGHFLQLAQALGVEMERGFTLGYDKYNWEEAQGHFITADATSPIDFGEGKKGVYALPGAQVLVQRDKEVQLSVNEFGAGRCVYMGGLPYSAENARLLHRALLWSLHRESGLHTWHSENPNVDVHAYVANGKYCVVNNTYVPQSTTVYPGDGKGFPLELGANEIRWFGIGETPEDSAPWIPG